MKYTTTALVSLLSALAAPPAFSQADELKEQQLCAAALVADSDLLGVVLFELGDSALTQQGRLVIAALATEMKRRDPKHHRTLLVIGHADQSGGDKPNMQLSLLRSRSVAAEIQKNDKDRTSADIVGCGQASPLLPQSPEAEHPHNRRVELRLRVPSAP